MALRLYGTPRSHFTRVVRVLARELDLECEWVDVGNVAEPEAFGGNPLMQVPVLVDGGQSVWEAHSICCYLVEREGRDPLGVSSLDWPARNLLCVIQGVMAAEVRLILAERTGINPVGGFFDKARETLRRGTAFVDANTPSEGPLGYTQVWAIAMWDHLRLYDNARPEDAPRLEALVDQLSTHASIAPSRPA